MSIIANISNISKGSFHDGDGIRTVVYFKGCNLRCAWCHNPETLSFKKEILFAETKCCGCGRCISVCPECHFIENGRLVFDRRKCTSCGKCAEACPTSALSMNAKAMSVDDVMREIKKDRHYYEQSGGGVTFSGGECLLHREFLLEVLKKCKSEGIHTAIESALFVPAETLREVTPLVDLFFADLKIADSEKHRKYTGHDNELIIRNLDYLSRNAKRLIIRIPLIPSVNDSEEDIIGFARIISGFGDRIEGVEVLKYNYLGKSKYEQMGMQFSDFGDKTQTNEFMEEYTKALSEKIKGKAPVYYRK